MTGRELRELLASINISQRAAAYELGINERTMRRYVAARRVPKLIELAIRYLAELKDV